MKNVLQGIKEGSLIITGLMDFIAYKFEFPDLPKQTWWQECEEKEHWIKIEYIFS